MTDLDVIKNQIDIVDLISNTAPLKKAGKYYKSNCPFHQEKTPSFIVDDVRQTWRCYGACSMGGDIFSFVMKAENIEFVEALHVLAETAGIQLESQEKVSDKGSLFDITLLAQKFFQDSIRITEGKIAAEYLSERGLSDEMISKFGLGYSPRDGKSLKRHLLIKLIKRKGSLLFKSGLLKNLIIQFPLKKLKKIRIFLTYPS